MSRADPKLVKKLEKYSKSQIIEALTYQFNADYYISGLLNHLEAQESDRLLKEHSVAIDAEISARHAYIQWRNEMCEKYGDGKTVKIADIPQEEIKAGATLERALKTTIEAERKLDKKVSQMLKLEE